MPARLQPTGNNRSVVLDKPIIFIGRHPDCDVVIPNSRKVSRKHCCLAEVNGVFMVRDLGSTNGVQINGRRVRDAHPICNGDELSIGDCVYTFHDGQINRESAPEAISRPTPSTSMGPAPIAPATPLVLNDPPTPVPIPHDLSSDIPILLDDSDSSTYGVYPNSRQRYRTDTERSTRNRADNDSHVEMAID